jgi:hypothetical protein
MATNSQSGNSGFTMVGAQKVYSPAFEAPKDRKAFEGLTQDKFVLPKSPMRTTFDRGSLEKLTGKPQPQHRLINHRKY